MRQEFLADERDEQFDINEIERQDSVIKTADMVNKILFNISTIN